MEPDFSDLIRDRYNRFPLKKSRRHLIKEMQCDKFLKGENKLINHDSKIGILVYTREFSAFFIILTCRKNLKQRPRYMERG